MLGRRMCKADETTVRNGYPNVLLNVLLTTKSKESRTRRGGGMNA